MAFATFPTLANLPDEVESAFAQRMAPAHVEAQARILHPFLLEVDHRPLSLQEIFVASEAFDLHETLPRRHLVVDVLEASPTRTRLHLRPEVAMTYCAIAREVDELLVSVGDRIEGSQMRTTRIEWVVEPVGVRTGGAPPGPEC